MREVWATPRPVPTTHLPKVAGGAVIALALPVFLAAAGARGVGMMFRSVAVMVVVIVVAASDPGLGVAAGLVYALAYTLELALSLMSYFASEPTR